MITEPGKARLKALDALRGFCALLVVFQHSFGYMKFSLGDFSWITDSLIDIGRVGVVGFFAISGYVIPHSIQLDSQARDKSKLGRFWVKRFFRLWPLYILVLLVAVFTGLNDLDAPLPKLHFLAQFSMLQQYAGIPNVLGVFWTLSIELVFYFIISLLFWFGFVESERKLIACINSFLLLALFLGVARFFSGSKLPVALFLSLAVMFFGSYFRIMSGRISRTWCGVWLVALVVICCLSYSRDYGFGETPLRYICSYCVGIALFVFSFGLFNSSIFSFLGLISYSMYLCHPILLKYLASVGLTGGASYVLLAVALIVAVSTALYFFLEKPFITLGRRLSS